MEFAHAHFHREADAALHLWNFATQDFTEFVHIPGHMGGVRLKILTRDESFMRAHLQGPVHLHGLPAVQRHDHYHHGPEGSQGGKPGEPHHPRVHGGGLGQEKV